MTYGTTAAPLLSDRVLKQLALDYKSTYAIVAKILLDDFYFDDCLHAELSLPELIYAKRELEELLKLAVLQLQKWTSNGWYWFHN
uniref:Uncharacterized protein n=1 Tax=Megaselia scalaris TaxID=36166 RepID=T1GMH1_MEGSC